MKFLPKSTLPNSFTALNTFCGFLSIVLASQGDKAFQVLGLETNGFLLSCLFIIFAAFFDTFDGMMARLTHSSSRFGVELDSLSDVVSFGCAPAFLIYQSHMQRYGIPGIILSSFLLISGSFRLARFNVHVEDIKVKKDFTGLPIPSSAVVIASLVYSFYVPTEHGISMPAGYFVIPLILLLSYLMVSNIRYNALPKLNKKGFAEHPVFFLSIVISALLIIFTGGKGLFYAFICLILFGILRAIFNHFFKKETEC